MDATIQISKRHTTLRRHAIIREKVNEYYARRIEGIRLDYDGVIRKVAEDHGYSERYVKEIMKAG